MDEPKPSLKFRYDMFMLRHKKEFLRAIIVILVILVVILLAVFLSDQKWEFGLGSESGQPAEQPSTPAQQPSQPFWPWEQPAQTTQPPETQKTECPDSSVEITDLRVDQGLARVIVKNTGTRSIKFSSVVFYDKYNNAIPTDTSLQRTYEYLNVDAFTFTDQRISCDTFSRVVVETDCEDVTATFDSVPSGC